MGKGDGERERGEAEGVIWQWSDTGRGLDLSFAGEMASAVKRPERSFKGIPASFVALAMVQGRRDSSVGGATARNHAP